MPSNTVTTSLRVQAVANVRPERELPICKPLQAGWGPVVVYKGRYLVGRILECEAPIPPGRSGNLIVGVVGSNVDTADLEVGSVLELRDGPNNIIAIATVTGIERS